MEPPLVLLSLPLFLLALTMLFFLIWRCRHCGSGILLLGYSCYLPDPQRRVTRDVGEFLVLRTRKYCDESADFMRAIFSKSGLSGEVCGPPYLFQPLQERDKKHPMAIQEAEESLFSVVSSLLCKTDVAPHQISFVIVACSMFSPSPSLSSMLVKRFGFSKTVKTYTLSGMGCSAGTVCVDMASRLLRNKPGLVLNSLGI
jgi:3-ketoacyl-CoA synthase